MEPAPAPPPGGLRAAAADAARTARFWAGASRLYFSYKATQVRAAALGAAGWDKAALQARVWDAQHEYAGALMYDLFVSMRGFYLKAGQFIGARGDFVPEPICRRLASLHDQVPPMPPAAARAAIEAELGGARLEDVFEWIDLEQPLGSASIAQVHKARLRRPPAPRRGRWAPLAALLPALRAAPRGAPPPPGARGAAALLAPRGEPPVDLAAAAAAAPADGVVAVKIQYPNALPTMALDLANVRAFAAFLAKAEVNFDLLSAVDELAAQVALEFDFRREARVMDAVARQFEGLGARVAVPRSVPALTTPRLLTMSFLDGVTITRMRDQPAYANLSEAQRRLGARRILSRVSEAYGRMVLLDGLFQADGHPGNILVMKGGRVGLIDYGQSKQLPDAYRGAYARLVLALNKGTEAEVAEALARLGVGFSKEDVPLQAQMARGCFDTTGKVDPFDPESPIKKVGITAFPRDLFFVLRVTQLLRGLATGMGVADFSCAAQWRPFAAEAARELRGVPPPASLSAHAYALA
jgi:predicted unusual protein kinase regulating ubiquinone biosynthesis (AarF/ABC1/UbiB family)